MKLIYARQFRLNFRKVRRQFFFKCRIFLLDISNARYVGFGGNSQPSLISLILTPEISSPPPLALFFHRNSGWPDFRRLYGSITLPILHSKCSL